MKSTMFVCTHSIVGINETSTNGETVTVHETKEATTGALEEDDDNNNNNIMEGQWRTEDEEEEGWEVLVYYLAISIG